MQVVPVIDLKGGQVVRGIAGRRDEYQAVRSVLAADARPSTVAAAFAAAGFRDVYVADLDAIAGQEPAWSIYDELARAGLAPWIDAGLTDLSRARALAEWQADGHRAAAIIAGLESLAGPEALADMLALVGNERLVFSLDMKAGRPLTPRGAWQHLRPVQIATVALRLGVRRMIVLDLANVGVGQGVSTLPLCRELRACDAGLHITGGGGVRSLADLRALAAAGCNAALVASALHDGRISPRDCWSL